MIQKFIQRLLLVTTQNYLILVELSGLINVQWPLVKSLSSGLLCLNKAMPHAQRAHIELTYDPHSHDIRPV